MKVRSRIFKKDTAIDFMDSPSETVVPEFLDIFKVLLEILKDDGLEFYWFSVKALSRIIKEDSASNFIDSR